MSEGREKISPILELRDDKLDAATSVELSKLRADFKQSKKVQPILGERFRELKGQWRKTKGSLRSEPTIPRVKQASKSLKKDKMSNQPSLRPGQPNPEVLRRVFDMNINRTR